MEGLFPRLCRLFETHRPPYKVLGLSGVPQSSRKLSMRSFASFIYKQTPRTHPIKTNKTAIRGAYALLIIPGAAFCLGTWQVYRRGWKIDLIEELKKKTRMSPIPLPEDLTDLENMEYVPVSVHGHFDHDREFFLGPRPSLNVPDDQVSWQSPSDRRGFCVITPYILSDRSETILVNRGWVNERKKDPASRLKGQIEGEIALVGLVRRSEKHGFGRAAMAENNTFMWRDIDKMAWYADTAPVFIDAITDCNVVGGPIGGQTRTTLRNEHASYIATWYSLALLTFILWFYRYKRPPLPDRARIFDYYTKQR